MTSATAIDIFNIIQDKYGSPNLIEGEILKLLNMAQYERLNRIFPDDMGGEVNVELDQNVISNIKPLIYSISGLNMSAAGLLTNTTIDAALTTEVGESAELFRVLSIALTSDSVVYPVKYTKQNNLRQYVRNYFKTPALTSPRYTISAKGLVFAPIDVSVPIQLTVVKRPRTLTAGNSPDFDDYNLNQIIMIALKYSGISVRDSELLQQIENTNIAK